MPNDRPLFASVNSEHRKVPGPVRSCCRERVRTEVLGSEVSRAQAACVLWQEGKLSCHARDSQQEERRPLQIREPVATTPSSADWPWGWVQAAAHLPFAPPPLADRTPRSVADAGLIRTSLPAPA